ncbi:MAG: HepT-like ribonuclease domain-containing protein [Methanobacteriota archaeon]
MRERYLKKLETFEKEKEFIKSHKIVDDVTQRAMLYSLQICVETAMDIAAMKIKESGMIVEDDYSKWDKKCYCSQI